ncbi:MAG: MFS transporter [Acidobacteriota bacterium]
MRDPHTAGIAWRYGLLGLPLAFVSLPLYVMLPRHYAEHHGVPLATLGALLLGTRLLDAVLDPRIGQWVDRLFARHPRQSWAAACVASVALAAGFTALWQAPARVQASPNALLVWLGTALVLTYLAYSLVSMVHQAWGARWGGLPSQRARLVAWREGAALVGVLTASVLPGWLGLQASSLALGVTLVLGLGLLHQTLGSQAATAIDSSVKTLSVTPASPWSNPAFVALLVVFMLNGTASAMPATLLPFFVRDTLQSPDWEPLFLGSYFAAAAVGLPLWVRLIQHQGLARSWLWGMALSTLAFCAVPWLGPGDTWAFEAICVLTGLALGADLAVPGAMLTGLIHRAGAGLQGEGRYLGWWTAATKLNLALASGLALPLLAWIGYQTGVPSAANQALLAATYGALPCLFKLLAAVALWHSRHRHPDLKD